MKLLLPVLEIDARPSLSLVMCLVKMLKITKDQICIVESIESLQVFSID